MNKRNFFKFLMVFFVLLSGTGTVLASPQALYQQAMQEAAQGQLQKAQTRLQAGMQLLHPQDIWFARLHSAHNLLQMRAAQQTTWQALAPMQQSLGQAYVQQHAAPKASPEWLIGALATFLPGSGHAYLGLWRDALSACILVIPILILTLWAARREMGPVTVFFGIFTVWLWSGTVFSAVSLAQRGSQEAYLLWWQGLWQATALAGQPW